MTTARTSGPLKLKLQLGQLARWMDGGVGQLSCGIVCDRLKHNSAVSPVKWPPPPTRPLLATHGIMRIN